MVKEKIAATPSIKRLPLYLQIIRQIANENLDYISGTTIAWELGLAPIQVRKDLAITGIVGKPKKGYPAAELITAIERFLGWDEMRKAVIVGAGNLGTALAGYSSFKKHGLSICAAFDIDPKKAGGEIHGIPVLPLESAKTQIERLQAKIAILTVPHDEAQDAADAIIEAGIEAIWNFSSARLKVPSHVALQREDLTSGYAMLCVKMNIRNKACEAS